MLDAAYINSVSNVVSTISLDVAMFMMLDMPLLPPLPLPLAFAYIILEV
jgi:hypothetical protein